MSNLRAITEADLHALPREALIDIACERLRSLELRGLYIAKEDGRET